MSGTEHETAGQEHEALLRLARLHAASEEAEAGLRRTPVIAPLLVGCPAGIVVFIVVAVVILLAFFPHQQGNPSPVPGLVGIAIGIGTWIGIFILYRYLSRQGARRRAIQARAVLEGAANEIARQMPAWTQMFGGLTALLNADCVRTALSTVALPLPAAKAMSMQPSPTSSPNVSPAPLPASFRCVRGVGPLGLFETALVAFESELLLVLGAQRSPVWAWLVLFLVCGPITAALSLLSPLNFCLCPMVGLAFIFAGITGIVDQVVTQPKRKRAWNDFLNCDINALRNNYSACKRFQMSDLSSIWFDQGKRILNLKIAKKKIRVTINPADVPGVQAFVDYCRSISGAKGTP